MIDEHPVSGEQSGRDGRLACACSAQREEDKNGQGEEQELRGESDVIGAKFFRHSRFIDPRPDLL